jgi:hypothetical protein
VRDSRWSRGAGRIGLSYASSSPRPWTALKIPSSASSTLTTRAIWNDFSPSTPTTSRCTARRPEPVVSGKKAFGEHYARNRFNLPDLHARLINRIVSGRIVVDQEQVTGVPGGTLAAVAVYEVIDGRIRTVWFF